MNLLCHLFVKRAFIPTNIRETLLHFTNDGGLPATVGHSSNESHSSYRTTNRHRLPDSMVSNIRSSVYQLHQDLLSTSSTLKSVEEPQLLSYGPGGKYDPHNDSEDFVNNELTRVVPRDWTMIWYLNDNYEGGKLDFCRLGITFNPKAGDMIIFPSYAEFEHAVTPVTRGVRKCLVTWIETDRRVYER